MDPDDERLNQRDQGYGFRQSRYSITDAEFQRPIAGAGTNEPIEVFERNDRAGLQKSIAVLELISV